MGDVVTRRCTLCILVGRNDGESLQELYVHKFLFFYFFHCFYLILVLLFCLFGLLQLEGILEVHFFPFVLFDL